MKFLKLFIRKNLVNNKLTYLNIAGLTLGMFTFLFIYFYVYTEKNYDRYLPDSNKLYHLEWSVNKNGTNSLYSSTPIPLAETIYDEVAGIQNWATYCYIFETAVLDNGESDFLNPVVLYANPGFLETFHYKAISGNLRNALEPGKVVITRSAAKKYLGTGDAIGKHLKLLHDKKEPLEVTVEAVVEDIPNNSNIQYEIVGSIDDYLYLIGDWVDSWNIKASQSYITLKKGVDLSQIEKQISLLIDKYINSKNSNTQGLITVSLDNISEKHFKKDYTFQFPIETFVSKTSLQVLFIVGLVTLIISWLNYINFLIFQQTKHFREIGIRKIIGSTKRKLIFSMIKESILLTIIPIVLTLVLFYGISPLLYNLFHLHLDNININIKWFWMMTLGFFLIGSVLSAIYPIFRLTGFRPVELIRKKTISTSDNKIGSTIISLQFVLSIILICAILGINRQMKFLDRQDLGFTKENIMVLAPPVTSDINTYNKKMELFKEEASKLPGITALSATSSIPGKKLTTQHFGLKNKEETINKYLGLSCDGDYFEVIDAKLIAGSNFSKNPEISRNEIIINKKLLHKLGFTNPLDAINQPTNWGDMKITGVVEDYHHTSLHDNIKPMLFKYGLDRLSYFMIRSDTQINKQQIEFLRHKWQRIFTNSPFEYSFLESKFDQQYTEEKQLSKIVLLFSILSVFITVLGIIGTCLNTTYLRTKEIGVRKVNGAKVSEILTMFNADFVKWVAIAFILACPVAWYAMHKWMENFAYRTNLSWWMFATAGGIAMTITLLTVSWQSWRAATRNPVEALRYE